MRKILILLGIFVGVTLVPLVPFILWNDSLETTIVAQLKSWSENPWSVFAAAVGFLGVDLVLPIPSSVISVLVVRQLSELIAPPWVGTAVAISGIWLGMTIAALSAWVVGRLGGEAVVRKLAGEEFDQLNDLAEKYGATILVLFRAVPLFAEAAALLLGCARVPFWRTFFLPIALSNLGIALVYGILGTQNNGLPLWAILLASIVLPATVSVVAKSFISRQASE